MSTDLNREKYPASERKRLVTREITIEQAREFIERYEYLGKLGMPKAVYGTFLDDELLNAECFGIMPGKLHTYLGVEYKKMICLERGASRRHAPDNTAHKAITDSIEQASAKYGWTVFVAYADPYADESGQVYKADSRWHYLGRNVGRGGGRWRYSTLPPGTWREVEPGVVTSDRAPGQSKLFRGKGLNFAQAKAEGWCIVKVETKHVFVRFVGDIPENAKAKLRPRSEWPTR
jgi:hypothetical protein